MLQPSYSQPADQATTKMPEMGRTWGLGDIPEPLKESTLKPTLPQGSELPPPAQLQETEARVTLQST